MRHLRVFVIKFLWILFSLQSKDAECQDNVYHTSLVINPSIVNENSSQILTCQYKGNGNISTVAWFANDITQGALKINGSCLKLFWRYENLHTYTCDITRKLFNLTIKHVERSNRSDVWRCEIAKMDGSRGISNSVTPAIIVPIESVTMTIPISNDTITIEENLTYQFKCVTSGGLPKPKVKWYNDSRTPGDTSDDKEIVTTVNLSNSQTSDNLIMTTSTLTLMTSKYDDKISIYCSAYSSSDQTPLYSAHKPKLNVLHSPDGPAFIRGFSQGVPYRVIENKQGQLTCQIKGGNPLPTLTWTCHNIGTADKVEDKTVSKTARWTATRGPDINCTCYYSHPKKSGYTSIQVQTLYPPSKPVFYLKSTEVNGTIQIVKHNPVSITCLSSGRPNDIEYIWTSITSTTIGKELMINKVENNVQFICDVKNFLDQSDGEVVVGSNSATLFIEMLYPPVVEKIQNQGIVEGDTFTIPCPVTVGNPATTSFKWTALNDTRSWNTQILTIVNVSRDDAMVYSCEAKNFMKETGELQPTSSSDSETFFLNVFYGATVKEFYVEGNADNTSVTVNETENVHFYCNVDSNPGSYVAITNATDWVIKSGSKVNSLNQSLTSVTCLDAGTYTCSGSNGYSSKESTKQLTIIVNCAPMLAPKFQIKTVFQAAELQSAVFSFKCVAYPEPFKEDYVWFRWYNGQWYRLKNSQNFQINTDGFESNLTVHHVNKTLYGIYKLSVKNKMGQFEQLFLLQDAPIQCSCTDSNTTCIIIGVVLGLIIALLVSYASYATLLLKRKGDAHKDQSQSRNLKTEIVTNISTYANLAFSTDGASSHDNLDTKEPRITEYTTLDKNLRSENLTYEVLDTSR